MSKIIYTCFRNKELIKGVEEKMRKICNSINADNISPNPSFIFKEGSISYGISNPLTTLKTEGPKVLLGKLFQDHENWQNVKENYPDGNYAIFRANEDKVEVVADILGTRTIWYYKDENYFICSTSQRAIIRFLGDFHFQEKVIPWMISSGSLGPSLSWDKRIKRIFPSSSLILDKNSWKLDLFRNSGEILIQERSDTENEQLLKKSIYKTFSKFNIDYNKWVLSLSGGHDCRSIILMLKETNKTLSDLRTITWGTEGSEKEKGNDAFIAREVANTFNTKHTFFKMEDLQKSAEEAFDRFLKNGEGRIDHFSGYTDGFEIWKTLFENKIEGVLRGDQVFGQKKPDSIQSLRSFIGISLCADFNNLQKYEYIRSLKQELPPYLRKEEKENLSLYREKLLRKYRIPVVQAALSDLKLPYIEQFSPLLSKEIINETKQLPDHLRDGKYLFQKIVKSLDPGLAYADKNSTWSKRKILLQTDYIKLIEKELHSEVARTIFPQSFLEEVIHDLKLEERKSKTLFAGFKQFLSQNLSLNFKKKIHKTLNTPKLEIPVLAFRLTIISRMAKLLQGI